MLRYAIIFLIISLIAGGLGLANLSAITRRISLVLFAICFLIFIALLGLAFLAGEAIQHASAAGPPIARLQIRQSGENLS